MGQSIGGCLVGRCSGRAVKAQFVAGCLPILLARLAPKGVASTAASLMAAGGKKGMLAEVLGSEDEGSSDGEAHEAEQGKRGKQQQLSYDELKVRLACFPGVLLPCF